MSEIQHIWDMDETELCRLCTNVSDPTNVEKLFHQNQRKLLRQIEELIGQRLINAKHLPRHICKPCEEQTQQAHAFRAQCLRAQHHFIMQRKTKRSPQRNTLTEEFPPIEEVVLSELSSVKKEHDEEQDDSTSPQLRVLKLPLKQEHMNSDDYFDMDESQECFNPLDKERHTTDEEAMMTIEPEISFFADEKYFPDKKSKIKSEKKEKPTEKTKIKRPTTKQDSSTKERTFICDQCGINTISRSALEIHLRRHTGEKPFKCEICPESFILNSDLKVHILKHTVELPYPCSICDRRFSYKSNARKHERKHTNERPHICPQCGKGFTVPDTLKAHMVVHTGERAFVCKLCNMAFKRKTHLITHYRSMTHKQNEEKHQVDTMVSSSQQSDKVNFSFN